MHRVPDKSGRLYDLFIKVLQNFYSRARESSLIDPITDMETLVYKGFA
jgi:hypothetical protein